MYRWLMAAVLALTCLPVDGVAQAHGTDSPHRGKEAREIKSLSEDEVQGYLAGRGMGFAVPAELNRYPGPRHVLDLSRELHLSEGQVTRIRKIFEEMERQAVPLGREYVDRERELDRLFARRVIDEENLRQITREIGRLQAELRYVHLRAHLQTTELLTAEQIRQYNVHRGYTPERAEAQHR